MECDKGFTCIEAESERDTFQLGVRLGGGAEPGDVFLLHGEMGAGKTVLAQGFAKGLGIGEPVASPTFTILQEYDTGRLPLYHFDVYRLESSEEMEDLGYEAYFYGEGVCLVEWAQKVADVVPPYAKEIHIEKDLDKGCEYRRISVREGCATP